MSEEGGDGEATGMLPQREVDPCSALSSVIVEVEMVAAARTIP